MNVDAIRHRNDSATDEAACRPVTGLTGDVLTAAHDQRKRRCPTTQAD
ncbi:hypothetical protein [Streptomyces sp. PU-14G]